MLYFLGCIVVYILCNKIHIKIALQYLALHKNSLYLTTKARRIHRKFFIFRSCIFSPPPGINLMDGRYAV